MKKIKIIENPSEIAAGTRGASLGIAAIKIAGFKAGSHYFNNVETSKIEDENHLLFDDPVTPYAKKIGGVLRIYQKVCNEVAFTLREENAFPIVLAGDHSSAGGTIAGIKKAYPDKRLGVIWIDAHADLHTPYSTPSGNMHGMPLAASIGDDNIEQKTNDIDGYTANVWNELKNVGGVSPKISAEDLVLIGCRSAEDQEEHIISKYRIKDLLIEHVKKRGVETIAEETLKHLDPCDLIYISFDVDSMDASISSGTGTPMPDGLTETEASELINHLLIKSDKICCMEIAEVNPCLDDKCNLMAENAFMILEKASKIIRDKISNDPYIYEQI